MRGWDGDMFDDEEARGREAADDAFAMREIEDDEDVWISQGERQEEARREEPTVTYSSFEDADYPTESDYLASLPF